MEFREKLRKLRSDAGLTQEELAERLFVSRVTVSKWESGRGYPNIESLKLMAKILSVSIDDLLSGEELVSLAESQAREASRDTRFLVFGLLDFMFALLFALPVFGEQRGDRVESVALPAMYLDNLDIRIASFAAVIAPALFGVAELALQNFRGGVWLRVRIPVSAALSILTVFFFIATRQPYAASFTLCILLLKGVLLIRKG